MFQKCFGIKIFLDNNGMRILSFFCLTVPQKLRGGTLLCFRNVPITKTFWIVGVSGFCLDFLSHSAKKIQGGTLMGFRNVLLSKNFWISGVSGFCLFFGISAQKLRGGTLPRFRNVLITKTFG